MVKLNRKPMLMALLMVMVVVAVYINWKFTQDGNSYDLTDPSVDSGKILGESVFVNGNTDMAGILSTQANGALTEFDDLSETGSDVSGLSEADLYFVQAAMNRQKTRDEAIEIFTAIAQNESYSEVDRSQAVDDIAAIALSMEKETNIENLIMAKGFERCFAVISGDNVNVVVKTAGLVQNEVAQIKDIVISEAGSKAIKITEIR